MFEKLNHIELSGDIYPLKCDLLVLERIQEEFGDVSEFENRMIGFEPSIDESGEVKRNEKNQIMGFYKTPEIKVLKKALFWMVEEGIHIEKDPGKETPEITESDLMRKVDIPPRELGELLQKEFGRCFERKNKVTTQRKEEAEKTE